MSAQLVSGPAAPAGSWGTGESGLVVVIGTVGRSGGRAARFLVAEVAQDLFDAILVFDRFVEAEVELGNAAQPQRAADVAAKKRRRALQRLGGLRPRPRIAERRVE